MYLNIINNIKYESKRKSEKTDYVIEREKTNLDNEADQIISDNPDSLYYSVFYGDLTKNWIKLKH